MSAEFLEEERAAEAMREPTDEQLLAIEAAQCEGAPDDFDPPRTVMHDECRRIPLGEQCELHLRTRRGAA